jgi:hypothetical protein
VKDSYSADKVACGLMDCVEHPERLGEGSKLYNSLSQLKMITKSMNLVLALVIDRIYFASQTKHT